MNKSKSQPMVIFGVACLTIMMILLVLGESTLPLFGGDRERAGRFYATTFMLLSAWTVAGLAVLGMQVMRRFSDALLTDRPDASHIRAMNWLFTHAQPVVFGAFILIGVALAFWVWQFDTSWQVSAIIPLAFQRKGWHKAALCRHRALP